MGLCHTLDFHCFGAAVFKSEKNKRGKKLMRETNVSPHFRLLNSRVATNYCIPYFFEDDDDEEEDDDEDDEDDEDDLEKMMVKRLAAAATSGEEESGSEDEGGGGSSENKNTASTEVRYI